MIGAKVLLEIYRKYEDKWIVELLINDLIDWHDWFATYRILAPKGLICLGSNAVYGDKFWSPNTLNSAKLESGLDNSPMWDGASFNSTSHQMQLYELSQSSFYVSEAAHLIELAGIIGKPELTAHLAARETQMRALIIANLWDEGRKVFANKYPPGTAPSAPGASTLEVCSQKNKYVDLSAALSRAPSIFNCLCCATFVELLSGLQYQDFSHILLPSDGKCVDGCTGRGDGDTLAHKQVSLLH